jgi:methionine aminotransferase
MFPGLASRSFIVSSFGKTYHNTGWKMGYVLAPVKLTVEFRKIYQYVAFSTSTPVQYAFADFLEDEAHYRSLPDFYQQKRDFFRELIQGSRFKILPCSGSYFQLLGYDKISREQDYELAIRLTKEEKIAGVPVSVFYHDKTDNQVLRFCFAKNEDTLTKAAEILCKL